MTITNLILKNFKSYKYKEFEFSDGLTGIVGKNGAGKSTIFEAVFFALYGEIKGDKEGIRYSAASSKEEVLVELLFEVDSKNYKIKREFRGKSLVQKAYLYDFKDELLAESAKEVTKRVSKLVGMSKDAFLHTVFASQKELTALGNLKNEERKKIVRKLLGLEKIDKIELLIKQNLTDLNRDIKSLNQILLSQQEIDRLNQEINNLKRDKEKIKKELLKEEESLKEKEGILSKLQELLTVLKKQKEKFQKLISSKELLNQTLKNQNQNLKNSQIKLKELEEKQDELKNSKDFLASYKRLEEDIKKLQTQKELYLKKEGLLKEQEQLRQRYVEIKKDIEKLQQKVKDKDKLFIKKEKLEKELKTLQDSFLKVTKQEEDLNSKISGLNARANDLSKKLKTIKSLGKDSPCPLCTRPLLDEYDKVLNSLAKELNFLYEQENNLAEKELKKLKSQKESLQKNLEEIKKNLHENIAQINIITSFEKDLKSKENEFKRVEKKGISNKDELKKLKDVDFDEEKLSGFETLLKEQKPKYEELIGIKRLILEIPKVKEDIKNYESLIKKTQNGLKELEKEIKNHPFDEKIYTKEEERYKTLLSQKDELYKKLSITKEKFLKLESKISNLQNTLKRDDKQREYLQNTIKEKNDYEKLKIFLSEFKTKINSQISPRISQIASTLYSMITKGRYQHIEVSEEFDFFIYDEGVKYPIHRFSGGEIDLANLVLRIAISKSIAELNGSSEVGFLAFDEVFGSQDEERRYEILRAFNTIKEQYRQIFLISHENDIKQMCQRVIEV